MWWGVWERALRAGVYKEVCGGETLQGGARETGEKVGGCGVGWLGGWLLEESGSNEFGRAVLGFCSR